MDLSSAKSIEYLRKLQRAQNRCLAAMDAACANIDVTRQMEYMAEQDNFDALTVIQGLLLENDSLKTTASHDYICRLKEENTMLRNLNGLSPLAAPPPPLPKPNQLGFMSRDYDVEKLEASKKEKSKHISAIERLMDSKLISREARRALGKALSIIDASRLEDERLEENFWSYRRRLERDGLAAPSSSSKKRKRGENVEILGLYPELKRQDSLSDGEAE